MLINREGYCVSLVAYCLDDVIFGHDMIIACIILCQYSPIFPVDKVAQFFNRCVKFHHREIRLNYILNPGMFYFGVIKNFLE